MNQSVKSRIIAIVIAVVMALMSCVVVVHIQTMDTNAAKKKSRIVYYVKGSSKKYHYNRHCRSLARSKKVSKTTEAKAKKKLHLKRCKINNCVPSPFN